MLTIIETEKTPSVRFNSKTGVLDISGKSLTENAFEFYKPLLEKIKEYINAPSEQTTVNITFEYFNTASSKSMMDLILAFEPLQKENKLTINWFCESDNDDMFEVAEDFKDKTKMSINIIPVD